MASLGCSFFSCASSDQVVTGFKPITDEIGRMILVKAEPQRIVSLAPSITETLFALGLADRIVGVTSYCDYPAEAQAKEKVGDTQRPSLERIVALRADLVIISTASQLQQFVRSLDEAAIPVYVSDPRGVDGVLDSIIGIGRLTGASARAEEVTDRMRKRIEALELRLANADRPRVLCLLGSNPLITIGAQSFVTDLIRRAGGRSISDDLDGDYPHFSLETAIARRPDVIFIQSGEAELPEPLKETPAARASRVFHLDDDLLLRPGPRLVDGLEELAIRLHPEVFSESSQATRLR